MVKNISKKSLEKTKKSTLKKVAFSAMFLTACVVGADYVEPELNIPEAWNHKLGEEFIVANNSSDESVKNSDEMWWEQLNDSILNGLIEDANENNKDLKSVALNVEKAGLELGVAKSEFYPDVNLGASSKRSDLSNNLSSAIPDRTDRYDSIGVGASWELDLFGRVQRTVEAVDATYQVEVEGYRDTMILVYAEVARNYITSRTLQHRYRFARKNVMLQEATLDLVVVRFEAGISNELEVRQAEINLNTSKALLPEIERSMEFSFNRLAVLTGRNPGELHKMLSDAKPIPSLPEQLAIGVPYDMLRQRPDVRKAERQLAAQSARVGIATADLYPRLSIGGQFGNVAANSVGDVFSSGSQMWNFGIDAGWNLFDGGRTRNQIDIEDLTLQQAVLNYEKVVLKALEESENAFVSYETEKQRQAIIRASVEAAEKGAELVQERYKNGLVSFQEVIDVQRALFQQEDALRDSEGALVNYVVQIYRSLGGGFSREVE